MEPIPETREALDELDPVDEGLLEQLLAQARRVRELVPDCVGISLASRVHGVTLTLVATSAEIAVLDGIQYLADGPCIRALDEARLIEVTEPDLSALDEDSWQLFAEATAARAVRSTLTLPIMAGDRAMGTVNLYAASRHAFTGLHDELADVFGAWAPGAVSNADLSFETRRRAREAPAQLRDSARIATAVGIIAVTREVDEPTARTALSNAARQAGIDEVRLAEAIIRMREDPPPDRAG